MQQQSQLGIEWSGATGDQVKRLDAVITDYFAYKLTAYPALKTLCEDATRTSIANADYLLTFRRSGENQEPVTYDRGLMDYYGEEQMPDELR